MTSSLSNSASTLPSVSHGAPTAATSPSLQRRMVGGHVVGASMTSSNPLSNSAVWSLTHHHHVHHHHHYADSPRGDKEKHHHGRHGLHGQGHRAHGGQHGHGHGHGHGDVSDEESISSSHSHPHHTHSHHTHSHHTHGKSQLTTEGKGDGGWSDAEPADMTEESDSESLTEEDSLVIQLEDVQLQDIDTDEFDIIEIDLDQLGIEEEDIAAALAHHGGRDEDDYDDYYSSESESEDDEDDEEVEHFSQASDEIDILEIDLDQLGKKQKKKKKKKKKTKKKKRVGLDGIPGEEEEGEGEGEARRKKRRGRRKTLGNALVGLPRKIRIARPKAVHEILSVVEANTMKPVPKRIIAVSILLALSSLGQCIAEIIIEILVVSGVSYYIPFRLSFLCLTVLSALLGLFLLWGLKSRELDLTREGLFLELFVEVSLVVSDYYFLFVELPSPIPILWFRLAFMILDALNIVILCYIFMKLHLLRDIERYLLKQWRRRNEILHPHLHSHSQHLHQHHQQPHPDSEHSSPHGHHRPHHHHRTQQHHGSSHSLHDSSNRLGDHTIQRSGGESGTSTPKNPIQEV